MNEYRRFLALVLAFVLLPCGDLLAQSNYKAKGAPNPDEARRVVTHLGVGQHVAVKLTSGKTVRGHITDIADNHFLLLLDRTTAPTDIACGDVQRIGPNPSTGVTIAIIVGVVIVAVVVITAITANKIFG